jgi:hypothetical protein
MTPEERCTCFERATPGDWTREQDYHCKVHGKELDAELAATHPTDIAGVKAKLVLLADCEHEIATEALRVIERLEEDSKYAQIAENNHFEQYASLEDDLTEAQAEIERLRGALETLGSVAERPGGEEYLRGVLHQVRDMLVIGPSHATKNMEIHQLITDALAPSRDAGDAAHWQARWQEARDANVAICDRNRVLVEALEKIAANAMGLDNGSIARAALTTERDG